MSLGDGKIGKTAELGYLNKVLSPELDASSLDIEIHFSEGFSFRTTFIELSFGKEGE